MNTTDSDSSKPTNIPKVGFVSLGCPKALTDSELILTQLSAEGYQTSKTFEGADLVIDTVGEKTWGASLRSLTRGGALVTCGATTGAHPSADIQRLFVRQLSVHGSTMGSMEEFRRLIRTWEAGGFTPRIDTTFPLAEGPAAFERLEHPARLGKILIRIA